MTEKSKIHTTNYFDTFIEVAEDTKAVNGTVPSSKGERRTIAELQYSLISKNPYKYTSDDVFFQVYADRNDLVDTEYEQARIHFFSKGQPCFRASPLTKSYGFGVHSDGNGKVALYGVETNDYLRLQADNHIKKVKAMRSSKK